MSVKIANKASANVDNKARDEPFGQSGSRCSLFDPGEGDEEPFGAFNNTPSPTIIKFLCQVQGQREGGRYNLSVALLGRSHADPSDYGEALILDHQYQTNHLGDAYMLTQAPVIYSIHPNTAGTLGGAKLTVIGDSFTVEKDATDVIVGHTPCTIETASLNEIVCRLGAQTSSESGVPHDGKFGIRVKIWSHLWPLEVVRMVNQGTQQFPTSKLLYDYTLEDFYETDHGLSKLLNTQQGQELRSVPTYKPSARHRKARRLLAGVVAKNKKLSKSRHVHLRRNFDSGGHLTGIFVPPVTGNYTWITTAKEACSVWIGRSKESMAKILHSRDNFFIRFRDFATYFPQSVAKGNWADMGPAKRVALERQRRSSKTLLEKGGAYFVDSFFKSESTQAEWFYFSLGAVLHTTDINERDHPNAIDEKQFISMRVDTNYTKLRIILKKKPSAGQIDGSFTLTLGGKESRSIGAHASESEMAGALRELISDCSIEMAEPYSNIEGDGGGSATDCALGRGLEYRGLKATSLDGEECLRWDDIPDDLLPWDPWLSLTAGIDSNLCRNPWHRISDDTQPFCFVNQTNSMGSDSAASTCPDGFHHCTSAEDKNSKGQEILDSHGAFCDRDADCWGDDTSCLGRSVHAGCVTAPFPLGKKHCLKKCGMGQSSIVATFEGTHGMTSGTKGEAGFPFIAHEGVTPEVKTGDAFCGQGSLFIPNTIAEPNLGRFWGSLEETDGVWKTDVYPYLCFAYRIPPGSEVALRLHLKTGHGGRWAQVERYVILNTYKEEFVNRYDAWAWPGTPDNPGIIVDDQWHHTCMNIRQTIETAIVSHRDKYFISGYAYQVLSLRFHHPFVQQSTYGDNPFWIDEFSISKSERVVKKSAYPGADGHVPIRLQLVDVTKISDVRDEVEWQVTVSTAADDCSRPDVDFAIDTSNLHNVESADVIEVQEHSPPLEGKLLLQFGGDQIAVPLYSSAADLEARFKEMTSIGETQVTRSGTCQTGYGWAVRFISRPGDQPLISASLKLASDGKERAKVTVTEMEAGGVLMYPLPVDYFRQEAVQTTNERSGVQLSVHGVMAECELSSTCAFQYDADLTPSFEVHRQDREDVGTYLLTLKGRHLVSASGAVAVVTVDGYPCHVNSSAAGQITCRLVQPFLPPGDHSVSVTVPDHGTAANPSASKFTYDLEITEVEPQSFDATLPISITVHGAGFSPVMSENIIEIENKTCAPKAVSATSLVCMLSPSLNVTTSSQTSNRRLLVNWNQPRWSFRASFSRDPGSFRSPPQAPLVVVTSKPKIQAGGVIPSKGSAGGGTFVTMKGKRFDNPTVTIGELNCRVDSWSISQIVCETSSSAVGTVSISIENEDGGISDPSNIDARFEYVLEVKSTSPDLVGMGGGAILTVMGDGMVSDAETPAEGYIALSGIETFVVGAFQTSLTHEIHAVELRGTYEDEIQTLDLASFASTFRFQLFGSQSAEILTTDNAYLIQQYLNDDIVSPRGGRAQVTREGNILRIVFRGLGDVPLLETLPATASVTEQQKGVAPSGSFRLSIGDSSVDISPGAPADVLKDAFESLYTEALEVTKSVKQSSPYADSTVIIWTCKFLDFTDEREFVQIDQTSLMNGELTILRTQAGTRVARGSWSISIDGSKTKTFDVDASAAEVETELKTIVLPSVHGLTVLSTDYQPGWKKNRDYARQWILRLTRSGVVGLNADRCTSPLYMDWNPSACPETAADLWLNIHYYFWPALLPRPADLGEDQRSQRLQARCDSEAQTRGLKPGFCQVPMIRETAPICGQGSGISPPCWVQRWTRANVSLIDGSIVTMERDDTKTPGDTTKGYRAWRRLDWHEQNEARMPQLTANITGIGASMDIRLVRSMTEQVIPCTVVSVTGQEMQVAVPLLSAYSRPIAETLRDDAVYQAELELNSVANLHFIAAYEEAEYIRLRSRREYERARDLDQVLTFPGVWPTRSKLIFADETAMSFYSNSYINIPVDLAKTLSMNPPCSQAFAVSTCEKDTEMKTFEFHVNGKIFSISLWLLVDKHQTVPVVRSLRGNSGHGYALTLTADGLCKFWLGTGLSEWTEVVSGECPSGQLMHIAAIFDGQIQSLYIDGVLSESKKVRGSFVPNKINPLFVGGGCKSGDGPVCSESNGEGFEGHIEQFRIYSAALSPSVIAGHARVESQSSLHAEFRAHINGALNKCSGDCTVGISPANTPKVWNISPKLAWTGSQVTITGKGFQPAIDIGGGPVTVEVGSRSCEVKSSSDSFLVCTLLGPPSNGQTAHAFGQVQVFAMLPFLGRSLRSVEIMVTSLVSAITPSSGSNLGGTVLTISGRGLPSDPRRIYVDVGGYSCHVREIIDYEVTCELEMMRSSSADTAHPVSIKIDGSSSVCEIPGDCTWQQTLRGTPEILTLEPLTVSVGDTLSIQGRDLPWDRPSVRIGDIACAVTTHDSSTIMCTVGNGGSGRHHLYVQYETGYAQHTVDGCCPMLDVAFSISAAVNPSQGSEVGGQTVTISGSSFPSPPGLDVFIAGKRCAVLSAGPSQLVIETPSVAAGCLCTNLVKLRCQ